MVSTESVGGGIGDVGIKRRLLHGLSRNKIADDQFYVGLLGILMTEKASSQLNIRDVLPTRPWHSRSPRGPHGRPYYPQLKRFLWYPRATGQVDAGYQCQRTRWGILGVLCLQRH